MRADRLTNCARDLERRPGRRGARPRVQDRHEQRDAGRESSRDINQEWHSSKRYPATEPIVRVGQVPSADRGKQRRLYSKEEPPAVSTSPLPLKDQLGREGGGPIPGRPPPCCSPRPWLSGPPTRGARRHGPPGAYVPHRHRRGIRSRRRSLDLAGLLVTRVILADEGIASNDESVVGFLAITARPA